MAQIRRVKSWKTHAAIAGRPKSARGSERNSQTSNDKNQTDIVSVWSGLAAKAGLHVIRDGHYWRVAGPDGFLSGGYSSMADAEIRRDELALAARRRAEARPRACMTCEREFVSEGIHNRMCPACRTAGYQPIRGW